MTLPEVILWQALRQRPAGLRFRRQHPAGNYILDFFCPARRLAIEVDGEVHDRGDQPERDAVRDTWLKAEGVIVLRFAARDVLSNLDGVIRHVTAAAHQDATYPSTAFGGPPPPPGED